MPARRPAWASDACRDGGGSRTSHAINSAMMKPGMATIMNAWRQPTASAMAGTMMGPRVLASRFAPKFCVMPCARPRRSGETSAAIKVCVTGMMPPSATPMSMRAPRSATKAVAKPDSTEAAENTSVAMMRMVLRRPIRSEMLPMRRPEIAHAKENAAAMSPICACVRLRSGAIEVPRKAIVWRSRNTMPKLMLSRPISTHW